MQKKTFKIDGVPYDTLPNYLEKDGFQRPVTPENFTIQTVETEIDDAEIKAAHQAGKSLKLKQAENAFLQLVSTVPNVAIGDNSDALTAKIEASEMSETAKLSMGMKLLNAIHEVEIQGGSWYDLPETLHIME